MNYKESPEILKEISKVDKILIGCHRGPDMDCIGSSLAIASVLKNMGKDVTVICTSKVPDDLRFLHGADEIKGRVDFEHFDYSNYELFLAPDASSWQMIAYNPKAKQPKLKFIVIDHHRTNERFGDINLVDPDVTSVGELMYRIFEDWKVKIDKDTATSLLTGILGDTGVFMYPGSNDLTFEVVMDLMSKGANKDEIVLRTYRTRNFQLFKFLGEILRRMEIDRENKFVWSAIPYSVYEEYGKPEDGKEVAASMFMQSVEGTEFGLVIVEIEKKLFSISFRSRNGFDVSPIASELGGGGHAAASGARLKVADFDKAVEKILEVSRKYAKKTS